jgi:hypothetical protein
MRLEETIQMCFDKHYASFENRRQVLLHMICLFGNAFEWKDGELINIGENWNTFDGKLDENEKAKQWMTLEDVALKFSYDSAIQRGEKPVAYETYLERMKYVKQASEERGVSYLELLFGDTLNSIKRLRSIHEMRLQDRMSKKYSHIFTAPEDIKEDWAGAIEEVKEILEELNIDLESIR